ncbi:3-methyl-2-oxobutanoate hydroxymethyltransferase [Paucidesulfovibrio gracilis DSM 16080]|uniref:3-methyl-2-oxobutanoate hydroxymethyltransferase n=1 Tax=Paucidesulfovibrio gracilis DSM 16080 TaxID=1121449 RepID=A0A1T4X8N2_9BACT|nr:3-methyl-2-oxobutanoate hydroxymethyltransferase [Paucidesulfovibrio gracilis]SKA85445.1 3-methyl-2-oxobutanoate hydroxymethyltransferase [Paucidesulfovibrio gracilis DSM 16080]
MSSRPCSDAKPVTVPEIRAAKGERKLCMVTAYDYPSARIADQAGVDMILVGDSLAMVVLGQQDTLGVTMEDMLHHTLAASRGRSRALLVGDMPFLSYQADVAEAVRNAGRFLAQGRANAVKLEGGKAYAPHVAAMVGAGIPVVGHVGLTPQYFNTLGGFKTQGRSAASARAMLEDAKALEEAGAFAMVLEAVPEETAALITRELTIPTIGIGAGNVTDGQVLVLHDLLGLFDRFVPKFVKQYAQIGPAMVDALQSYCDEVRSGAFPAPEHTFRLPPEERDKLA